MTGNGRNFLKNEEKERKKNYKVEEGLLKQVDMKVLLEVVS